ncbi:MAG: DUF342 domain-containing protein [Sulfurospirillum sp.]|nr:DUF342 domain-containing protein [Sulfurospirillum sp.]MBL0703100.1 DUF342 domain-containing protein [Sulfurospirillum sp.]
MGLFDKILGSKSKKKQKDRVRKLEFDSIIVEKENIIKEMKQISSANNLSISQLDFKIIKVKTYYYLNKEKGWIEDNDKNKKQFKDKDFILSPDLKIKQKYKVDIFKIQKDRHSSLLPSMVLSGNKDLTKIIVTIKKNTEIKYFSKIENEIIEEINKKKIRAGMFVGVCDDLMHAKVKILVSDLKVNGIMSQDNIFVVCKGLDPILPIDDDFIYHYKKKISSEDKEGKVDYSKRGYILAVSKGDCIMEYIKPQLGVSGRNCQGKFMPVRKPNTSHKISIKYKENILLKENSEKIEYISDKNGYVVEDRPNLYNIRDNMEVGEISFKTTGSIETDMSSEVKINITESNVFEDAIGPGMNVETYELNIEGNVASGATIKANKLTIGGQTHKTSVIEAKTAEISIHHGSVAANEVNIERLEGGKVVGDIINVKYAIGGEIIGKNIFIEKLTSNVSITASDVIEIQELKGTNNKLLIDLDQTEKSNGNISKKREEIDDIELKLKRVPKLLEDKKNAIDKTRQTVVMVQEKIRVLKKDGKKPPSALFAKIKEFQKNVNEYNDFLKEYKNNKLQLKNLKEDLDQAQANIFTAKIINHSSWQEYNEVKFKLISPPVEKIYNTRSNEIIREMSLVETADGAYEIKKSLEYTT